MEQWVLGQIRKPQITSIFSVGCRNSETLSYRKFETLTEYWSGLKGMKFFLCVLGLVMIVEGLPYFAFPEKMKFWIQKIIGTPESSLRRFGLVLMALGLCLIYFGRT